MMMKAAGNHAYDQSLYSTHDSVVLIISTCRVVGGSSSVATIASSRSSFEAKSTDTVIRIFFSILDTDLYISIMVPTIIVGVIISIDPNATIGDVTR